VHGWISVLQLWEQNHTQAYQIVVGRSGQTPPSLSALPYTPEQLYFIAYGQVHTSSHTYRLGFIIAVSAQIVHYAVEQFM